MKKYTEEVQKGAEHRSFCPHVTDLPPVYECRHQPGISLNPVQEFSESLTSGSIHFPEVGGVELKVPAL